MNTLSYFSLNGKQKVAVDADNLFWGITNEYFIPQKLLSLYAKFKERLNSEFNSFRFATELSAIYINPTDRCNADCPYCYIPQNIRKNGRAMSREDLFFILKKIYNYFKKNKKKAVIVFHASEPLLVKDIVFAAIRKFSCQFKFGLQTNAILLEKEDIDFLKKYSVGVGISLDTNLEKVNNRLRITTQQKGNFKKAVQAIDWFDGYEGLNVITTVTKLNVRHLPDFIEYLHKKRVPCVLLNPVRLTQKLSHTLKPKPLIFSRYFIKAAKKAIELTQQTKHRIIIGNFTNTILSIVAPTARRLMCDISPCGGGRCFLTITASGNMIPCGEFIGLKRFSGGNILNNSIEQAMQSTAFKKIRSRIVEKIDKCNICIFRNICGAPCPAELYSLGDMNQKSVFCSSYKEIIKYAFKVIAERKERYCFRETGLNNLEYQYFLGR